MRNDIDDCCPECGRDLTAINQQLAEERRRTDEAMAAMAAAEAEMRVTLEQRMAAGLDVTLILEALEREGVDVSELLFP